MKLNIFSIPQNQIQALKAKFDLVKMKEINKQDIQGWTASFYFSQEPEPVPIPWVKSFANIFIDREEPKNQIYYGAYIWEKGTQCFVLSFGKSHFYLRQFCDMNFGLEIAKRIANEEDVRQKAAKRFAGRRRKEIRSYDKNTALDIESGESVDYIQASILDAKKWGKSGKFGASVLLYPEKEPKDIPQFLNDILQVYSDPKVLFDLPKTEIVQDKVRIEKYDNELIQALFQGDDNSQFSNDSHELIGVDFIFPTDQTYQFCFRRDNSAELNSLDIGALRNFIRDNNISGTELFNIRINIIKEDSNPRSVSLKESIEYKVDSENVILSGGKWTQFNEDYMKQLHTYIDSKIILNIELSDIYKTIKVGKGKGEPSFIEKLVDDGFEKGDKDFSKIIIPGHKIEAWDVRRDKTAYAIKFGTPQKVGYVCDQAADTLEIMRNKPEYIQKLNFENYCLWIGLTRENSPEKLSQIKSIIFKQKLESWVRKCYELGIKPHVWISKVQKV